MGLATFSVGRVISVAVVVGPDTSTVTGLETPNFDRVSVSGGVAMVVRYTTMGLATFSVGRGISVAVVEGTKELFR
jgi:hypothetical protein